MKKLLSLLGAIGLLGLLAACQTRPASTTAGRIDEKAAVFGALSAEQQKKLREGIVEVGDTADMVYVALGRPTRAEITADGKVGIWVFENYFPSEAVAPGPLYSIRPHPKGRNPLAVGASAPSIHEGPGQTSPAIGAAMHPQREGGALGTEWATSNYRPVTLRVAFERGHVIHLTTDASSR